MIDQPPITELEGQLAAWVTEALELRFGGGVELPPSESTPAAVHASLLSVRSRLDRIDGIYIRVLRARGRCRRAAKTGRYLADDAWDVSVTGQRRQDYQGPRERYAEASLSSFEQQRAARASETLLSHADDAYEAVRVAREGLNNLRADHVAVLRSVQFESSLER